jgi:hypothetical protein
MRYSISILLFVFFSENINAQLKDSNKAWSFSWGYNRAWFSNSDLHIKGGNKEDFTVYNVTAKDRPTKFTIKNYFGIQHIWIPQYNYRFGYRINKNWAISLGLDHMKYVMDNDQYAQVSGVISQEASPKYAGSYLDTRMLISQDFLKFEHTDGLNLLSFDAEYYIQLFVNKKNTLGVYLQSGVGGIFVIPRSDVRIFEKGLNNRFHLAGYSISAKSGPEFRFYKRYFLRSQVRFGGIYLPDVLTANDDPIRIEHGFTFLQWNVTAGLYFGFKKKTTAP